MEGIFDQEIDKQQNKCFLIWIKMVQIKRKTEESFSFAFGL